MKSNSSQNRRTSFSFLLLFSALLAPLVLRAQPAETGVITGRVSNAATQANLEGAVVRVEGMELSTLTERDGTYRLSVPAGNYSLIAGYTGLDEQTALAAVKPGATVNRDIALTSTVYRMEKMVVAGEREGNALAITIQKQLPNIKNVVSADAFGSLAGNPADLLIRLPGVEGVSSGGDNRYVRIRGINYNLSTITVDGNRVADAASAGNTREVQFQTVGSDTIERMEVTKSPTPDMDGDSIGGAVNLVTKSAFDSSPERRIRGSFGVIWRPFDPRETSAPRNYSLSYSEVFAGKLGVTFNAGYRVHHGFQSTTTQLREQLANGVSGPAYTYSYQLDDVRNERARSGGGLRLDYKLNDQVRLFSTVSYYKHIEHETEGLATWATAQSVATLDPSGNPTGSGAILPGYTESMTTIRPISGSTMTIRPRNNYKDASTVHVQVGATHHYETWDLDYDAYRSAAKADYPGNKGISFIARGVGFTIKREDEPFFPTITMTAGPDITKLSSYTENAYAIDNKWSWDVYRGASLNLKKKLTAAAPLYVKTGLRYREQTRRMGAKPYSGKYVGPDGVMGVNPATGINDDNLAQFGQTNQPMPHTKFSRYPDLPFPGYAGRGNESVDTSLWLTPQYWADDIVANVSGALTGNQRFKESIGAAFLMGNVDIGKFSLLGGVRLEQTEVEAEGALQAITPEEKARRAAWVGVVTNAELTRRTIAEYSGRINRSGKINDVFPGLHLKYQITPRLVARMSYATNIGRPSIGQLIPSTSINYDSRTVSTSNPDLKAQYANNYDVMAEYYLANAGVFSAGVFQKDIKRFIYTSGGGVVGSGSNNGFGGLYEGYALTTQYNGGSAKMKGFELNYMQQLSFLPGFWNGLGVYANYTKMSINGNYGGGTAISLAPTSEVPGFNPSTANAGVSFVNTKVSLRIQYNYAARYLSSYSTNQSRLIYFKARPIVTFKSEYFINRHYNLYLDVVNVLNEPDRVMEYYGGRPNDMKLMSPQVFIGIVGRL
jgi:iron complex outermembrane recepter protein